mgnify:CR=1 FL=1
MTFHSPIWLYAGLIAAIALIALAFYSRSKRRDMLSKFASKRLMPELTRTVSRPKIIAKNTLAFLSVMLIFAALARPQWGYRWEETKTRGIDIIFAIDTSNSMLAEDVKPDRLERAKLSVLDLVNILQGDKIGIVAFSGQAFLQCPLTLDYDAFRMSLEALDTNVIQRGGTNISAAIEEAEVAFASTSNRKIIVLISDGEELEDSALSAAKKAAENGVVIYTLGVGGANGEFIPVRDASGGTTLLKDESGNPVKSRLNEKTLTEIAKATGGFYEPLTADGMDIIYNEGLKKIPTQELSSRMKQLAIERFQIPLGLAILLLALSSLTGTRKFFVGRGGAVAVLFLSFALIPAPKSFAQDQQQAPQQAAGVAPIATGSEGKLTPQADASAEKLTPQADAPAEKPQEKKYSIPEDPSSRDLFNLGIDAKNAGDFEKAREFFLDAAKLSPEDFSLHSDIYYNIGNMDYAAAKSASSKMLAPQNVAKNTAAVFAQSEQSASLGTQTLGEGLKLLEEESKALKSAKDENKKKQALEKSPLKQNGFQEKLKQAISACESSSKAAEEASASIGKAVSQWEDLSKMIDKPVSEYSDALLLNPSNNEAAKNLKAAESAKSAAAKEMDKLSKISANSVPELQKIKQDLGKLVEELKKLLRDDNQNQQNQNNQNNQQNQQNQNNQNNQNNQQNQQNQQNQNNQQNQQDQNKQNQNNQDKQNQQNNQEQQGKDQQKDKQENQQDKQNEKDKGNQNNADKNKEENSRPNSNKNGSEDRQNSENKKDEQAIDNSQKSGGEDKKPESAQGGDKRDELPTPKKDEPAGAAGEVDKENVRETEGAMTRAEARQLLDSMKDDEKFLPLRGFGTQKQRYESSYKDW